jgi:acetylornithine/N-succinyldiaminopimelate aminotransferase
MTHAELLAKDPKVLEATKLFLEAVSEHQSHLIGIRPPLPELKYSYDQLLAEFNQYRGNKLYFAYLGSGLGNGPFVELLDGSVKYDFINGIGPHLFGHNHPSLIKTSLEAALSDVIMQGHLQQNVDALDFTRLLIKASKMDHCFLTTSGAMANENALKLAFQKKFPAHRILAFDRCFMGRTLASAQITDKPAFRDGLPNTYLVDYLPYFDPHRPNESTQETIKTLKKHLQRYPKQHAIMCFELIQGEGGFYSAPKEFFETLMQLLKENNIAIFIDEVQTFGRTSSLFAFQHFGLEKYVDIVSIGKLSQVCATLFNDNMSPKPGLLSQTFIGSTSALRAGIFIIQTLLTQNFFGDSGKNMAIQKRFSENFQTLQNRHPQLIQGPYGVGSMVAFTPFNGEADKVAKFVQKLFDNGVMSFVAGSQPTRVRFLVPSGVVSMQDIDAVCEIIESTLLTI